MEPDMERRQAIIELLAIPDAPDLHRGHRLTIEGRSDRYNLVRHLAAAFVKTKLLELHARAEDEFEALPREVARASHARVGGPPRH